MVLKSKLVHIKWIQDKEDSPEKRRHGDQWTRHFALGEISRQSITISLEYLHGHTQELAGGIPPPKIKRQDTILQVQHNTLESPDP